MKLKKSANPDVHEKVIMRKMANGVRRLYQAWLLKAEEEIEKQRRNAEKIDGAFYGDNGFMAIVRTENPEELKKEFAAKGIETETHFKHCIDWAKQFGYIEGSCPKAEELTKHLLMIPTYTRI
jgi:dTDP-4-amino-4,6-dideoxygalactose transaminase